ncbi:SHOCT domain-containing protein [Clostridium sp. HMP27]|uniref:SHOCT domain-containing protein n=1 Tax=Clostridium sp. HMP27 TaxID=1487921 RepID=UPI00052BB0B7|nr:SHOCT domain-containing protein [Clostridium sp. HMP27]KGK88056.1 hypothetical protein DP68_09025 [Clostridium sp. HMP27]
MGVWDNAKAKKEKNDILIKQMKENNQLFGATVKYSGGHREVSKACDGVLVINKLGVYFRPGITQVIYIPIEAITSAEYIDGTQISKDVTLTRLLLFNIFAFGLKKKKVDQHHFIVITYMENGMMNKIIFENKKAPEAVGAIMQAKQENRSVECNIAVTQEVLPSSQANEVSSNSIPDQIRQLAELKNEGILTEDEFNLKKSELLARL